MEKLCLCNFLSNWFVKLDEIGFLFLLAYGGTAHTYILHGMHS